MHAISAELWCTHISSKCSLCYDYKLNVMFKEILGKLKIISITFATESHKFLISTLSFSRFNPQHTNIKMQTSLAILETAIAIFAHEIFIVSRFRFEMIVDNAIWFSCEQWPHVTSNIFIYRMTHTHTQNTNIKTWNSIISLNQTQWC